MGKRDVADLQGQMDMIGHETESLYAVPESAGSFLKQKVETVAVIVGKEDRLAAVTPKYDMIESAGKMDAWFACHAKMIPQVLNLSTWKPDPKGSLSIYLIDG